MVKFLETYNLSKLNQGECEHLNRLITTNEIEAVIKNSQQTKVLDQMDSQVNFTKHLKKNQHLSFSYYSKKKNSGRRKTPKLILWDQHYPNSKTR